MVFKLRKGINIEVFEESIRCIVNRHEILRTLIKEDSKGNGYQIVKNY